MKILKRLLVLLFSIPLVLSINGCSTFSSKSENDAPKSSLSPTKKVSLNTNSKYSSLISLELEKEGFEIVTKEQSNYQIQAIVGDEIDWCQGKKSRNLENVTYKVNDIKSNKTLFILERGGWTTKCNFTQTSVFKKLAKMLSERWESPEDRWFYNDYIYF